MPVDYVELRGVTFEVFPGDAAPTSTATTKASHGTACATATDHDACVAALSAATLGVEEGWRGDGDYLGPPLTPRRQKDFLVFTRGDEVGVLKTRADLASFLGTVDTLEEARLVLQTRNLVFSCTTRPARSGWRRNPNGSWEFIVAGFGCGTPGGIPYLYRQVVSSTGDVSFAGEIKLSGAVCGRRPDGLVAKMPTDECRDVVANHFAQAAYLEAASVIAFRRLELELRRFGAPDSLVQRARRSRADEIRHAREVTLLARKLGATVPPVEVDEMAVRDVFACALENEVEGCVLETYGALQAAFQARMANPDLRPMLHRIAVDEARHAELAHDVARFLRRKLSMAERAKLDRARAERIAELRQELSRERPVELVRYAGMPTVEQALALLDGLEEQVLAA